MHVHVMRRMLHGAGVFDGFFVFEHEHEAQLPSAERDAEFCSEEFHV